MVCTYSDDKRRDFSRLWRTDGYEAMQIDGVEKDGEEKRIPDAHIGDYNDGKSQASRNLVGIIDQ